MSPPSRDTEPLSYIHSASSFHHESLSSKRNDSSPVSVLELESGTSWPDTEQETQTRSRLLLEHEQLAPSIGRQPASRGQWGKQVIIDDTILEHNMRFFQDIVREGTSVCAVIKNDAFSHDIEIATRAALRAGVSHIGFVDNEEADLIHGVISHLKTQAHGGGGRTDPKLLSTCETVDILRVRPACPDEVDEVLDLRVTELVSSLEDAQAYSDLLARINARRETLLPKCEPLYLKVHLVISAGCNRMGFLWSEEGQRHAALRALRLPYLRYTGIMTHFASSDQEDKTKETVEVFKSACDFLDQHGLCPPLKHCSSSGSIVRFPWTHFDMIRPGISVYGQDNIVPHLHQELRNRLLQRRSHLPENQGKDADTIIRESVPRPALTVRGQVVTVRTVPAGTCLGYDSTFVTERESRVATVSLGYSDGYPRALSNIGHVLVCGHRCPVVGRVSSAMTLVDVTEVPPAPNGLPVEAGTPVTFLGYDATDPTQAIYAQEIASKAGLTIHEVLCNMGRQKLLALKHCRQDTGALVTMGQMGQMGQVRSLGRASHILPRLDQVIS